MADAAQVLGISKEAIRKRVQRGTLRSDMGEDGRRYVYLDAGTDAGRINDKNLINDPDPRDDLIATLREQLEAERNAHAETRRIAYTLAQRVPELEAAQEPPGAAETPSDSPGGTDAPDRGEDAQEATESRSSWWRRWFGLE